MCVCVFVSRIINITEFKVIEMSAKKKQKI
jgi:hypothetical protein